MNWRTEWKPLLYIVGAFLVFFYFKLMPCNLYNRVHNFYF